MSETQEAPATQERVQFVVLDDPNLVLRRGCILGEAAARQHSMKGVALLPFDVEYLNSCGAGGYVARDFGAGITPGNPVSGPLCPLSLFVPRGDCRVHWRACIVPAGLAGRRNRTTNSMQGQVRLALDGAQLGTIRPGISSGDAILMNRLGETEPRVDGSWIVGGYHECTTMQEGIAGFSLWGFGLGWHVTWFAVSASRVEPGSPISIATLSPEVRGA